MEETKFDTVSEKPTEEPEVASEEDVSLVDAAKKEADRLEEIHGKLEDVATRLEKAGVERALAGKSKAGVTTKPKEQTPAEYAKEVMKGREEPKDDKGK